ncbi:MAG: histidinol-phosphate transaminase [Burkholderiaceae bacterium]
MSIRVPSYILEIAPYQAGKPIGELAREYHLDEATIVKLASNENPLGMSPRARDAMLQAVDEIERYPDSNGFELKAAIAARYGVEPAQITLGNGSNDLLELAIRTFVVPGDGVVYAEHAFAVYMLASQAVGARRIEVPARDFGHDLSAMADAVDAGTRLVFIANPNNPTGTFAAGAELKAFLERVPADVVVVLDQAYDEYLRPDERYDATAWLAEHPNLIICRTFSKAYGLAGLRLGFALASAELTDYMNRVRQPFNTNSLAQAAAVAALGDTDFLARSYEQNLEQRERLQRAFADRGLRYVPSSANFVMVEVGNGGAVTEALLHEAVIVRPIGGYGLPGWIRVSVGVDHENDRFLAALDKVLAADR